jgi:hypothetical protein
MKKLFILIIFTSLVEISCGQKLPKGSLLSIKIMEIQLVQGKSLEEFKNFYTSSVIPVYEKRFKGLKIYVLKSARGQFKNELAGIWIFKSEAMRNKYFTDDGKITDAGKEAMQSVKDIREEMNANYGKWTGNELDDWIVQ